MHFPVFKRAFAKMLAIHPKRWYDKIGKKKRDKPLSKNSRKECVVMGEHTALNIAKYTIQRCNACNTPISNLQLQKILYFTWIDYYQSTGENLFKENFFAWKLGPVVTDVYYKYHMFGARTIPDEPGLTVLFDETTNKRLNNIIDKYRRLSAFDLVEKSHEPFGAWDTVYKNGEGDHSLIPFSLMKQKCR